MDYLLLLTFILAPAYVIRFNFLGFPTDVLMMWIFFVWLVFYGWLIAKKRLGEFFRFKELLDRKVSVWVGLFFLSGIIALLVEHPNRANLGQFIVLFLQPISLFFIAGFIFKQSPKTKSWLLATSYSLLAISGLYAILQYFTLIGLPVAWWGNSVEPKRALAFFVHPNFYALWCAPLLALLLPDIGTKIKSWSAVNRKSLMVNRSSALAWLLGAIGLLLSLSRSGWLGLSAAIVVYVIIAADAKVRKIIFALAVAAVLIVAAVPNLRWRVLLPFYGEKSADSRIELWDDGFKGIKQSPIFGIGLTGFAKEYATINIDPTLDPHNFPHNIFLDFWVETGLLGLISFVGLASLFIYRGLKNRGNLFALAVSLFLIALLAQGQVDNPYFKNDLALVFWMVLALVI